MSNKKQLRTQKVRAIFVATVAPSTGTRPALYSAMQVTNYPWKIGDAQLSVQNNLKYRKDIVI